MKKLFTLAFMLLMFVGFAQDPGTLDETYGNGGTVDFNPTDYRDLQAKVYAQDDGKILVVSKSSKDNANYYVCITRQNPDGSIDATYGENGYAFFNLMSASITEPFDAVLADNGMLYIAGHINAGGVINKSFILCVDENGFAYSGFGEDGYVIVEADEIRAMAMDAEGNIYVGGCKSYANENKYDAALVQRYTIDGQLDTSFGDNGTSWIFEDDKSNYIYALEVDENNKVMVGGSVFYQKEGFSWYVPTPKVYRLNNDGNLDDSYGNNGGFQLDICEGNADTYAIELQSDGKCLVLGYMDISTEGSFSTGTYIIRLTTDGEIDTSFGDNGLVLMEILQGDQCHNYSREFVVAHDDQIFGTLYTQDAANSNYRAYAYNLNPDGTLNEDFMTGIVPLPWNDVEVLSHDVDLQRDGKLLVVGHLYDGTPDYRLLTSRLHTTVAPQQGEEVGTSEVAIEIGEITATTVELTFTPNEHTTEYFYGLLPKDQYEEYGEEFCVDYLYEYGMPTTGSVAGVMEDLEAETAYVVLAFGFNSEGERGTVTTEEFTTKPTSCAELNDIQFTVYPNPATTVVYVTRENDADAQVTILDVTGRCVKSVVMTENMSSINIDDVESGVYFIMVQQEGNSSVRKLVVK